MESWNLSFLGFTQFEYADWFLLPHLGHFQPLFLQNCFGPAPFLLSFWDSDDLNVVSFIIVPHSSDPLLTCFQSLLSCSDCVLSIALSSGSQIISPLCLLSFAVEFLIYFILVIIFFSFKFPFRFPLYHLFICWNFISL